MYRFRFFVSIHFLPLVTFVVRVRFVYFKPCGRRKPVGRLVIKFHFDNQSIFARPDLPCTFGTQSRTCLKGASTPLTLGQRSGKPRPCCLANSCPRPCQSPSTNVAQVHFVCYHNTCQTAMWRHSLQLCQPFLHRYERVAVADIVNLRR